MKKTGGKEKTFQKSSPRTLAPSISFDCDHAGRAKHETPISRMLCIRAVHPKKRGFIFTLPRNEKKEPESFLGGDTPSLFPRFQAFANRLKKLNIPGR